MPIIKEPNKISFHKVGHTGKVFPTTQELKDFEFVLLESSEGLDISLIQHESDFIYYIISGSGFFVIDGESESCSAGDLVIVRKGSRFTFKGNLRMLLCSNPPWKQEQEEVFN